ncbi:adenylate/guanylate cyclase domain-containing protein [Pseudodonghicola flavimaris]|uniref:Adenylate/guanylate cyclase domain-containing protein n=1 Tax=Pseudodonghicola flavimaris TaxID=3050036 RepID=A0ABT7EYP1_9RHOB|nr:adenylate/guanylate cyclase domain-containing protein [Pseudodonghicola flavimaris]MDK3017453.1 adenylate/guanylate cyclase domain-containing protein [Pseudodonghicola flavimaris]
MATLLWRGNWITKARIGSGLVLFVFALFHFLNIGLGLFSPRWMEVAQDLRQVVTRSLPGTILLYTALVLHVALALYSLASRRTLRMPWWNALQFVFGLAIPVLLIPHLVHTRLAHELFGVRDEMDYLIALIWNSTDGWLQALLLLLVWVHGCIGLHFWLRAKDWWVRLAPLWFGLGALIPAYALAGFMTEGRRMHELVFSDVTTRATEMARFRWPDQQAFTTLIGIETGGVRIFLVLLAAAALIHFGRRLLRRRRSVRVTYVDGPEITSPRGMTLLEMSRFHGVPHTALCGGRGRCTTCRVVIEEGGEFLPPPSPAEASSLRAVHASPNTRLACQIRPDHPLTVFRVFLPDGRRGRAHASQGEERRLAILFLDMRGFTARTTGQLPYDVVFLLNRFFDAIVPPILEAGGSIDKYLGDGLLAVFETGTERGSARAGLQATAALSAALADFNDKLTREGISPIHIGMGLHIGNLVLGEIGAAGNAPRTIIGDSVNTASRLEGRTKDLGVELLVSAPLLEAAGVEVTGLDFLSLDLRGRPEPLMALPLKSGCDLDALLTKDAA